MALTATRSISITVADGTTQIFALTASAASSVASPGQMGLVTLASGFNDITPPAGGSTPVALTIVPPAGNLTTITLKGVTGDTGIVLHLTDPTTIALNSPTAHVGLTAAAQITGVRLIWT